jgi:hypothetical protein
MGRRPLRRMRRRQQELPKCPTRRYHLLGRLGVCEYTLGKQKGSGCRPFDLLGRNKKKLLTLRGNGLDLGNHVGLDEREEVLAAEVQETGLEKGVLEVELSKVEAAKDAELGDGGQVDKLLHQEQGVEVENLVVDAEESIKLSEAEVLLESELLEDVELVDAVVDIEEVVQVGGLEAVEAAIQEVVEAASLNLLLSRRGGSNEGGESRNEDGGDLHFDGVGVNDVSLQKLKNYTKEHSSEMFKN